MLSQYQLLNPFVGSNFLKSIGDTINNKIDTLINQTYSGDWSFGSGVWDDTGEKFYFDNSGPAACIWDVDIKARTIDKIVPEHWAKKPSFARIDKKPFVMYFEKECVKKVTIEEIVELE